jgi:hypothetical protein
MAGCTTVNSTSVSAFSTGVTATQAETKTSFDTIVSLTQTSSIDRIARLDKLDESQLITVPDAGAIKAWNGVLDPVSHYAQHLSALVSGDSTSGLDTALEGLSNEFKATSTDLKAKANIGNGAQIPAGVAAAFNAAADAILQARGQKESAAIAKITDSKIRLIFTTLADAVGSDSSIGIRGTVHANWDQQLGNLKVDFLNAGTIEKRRPVVVQFIAVMNQRDAEDDGLASLRNSYLALADAHAAIVSGSETGIRSAIDLISTELKHARDLQTQYAAPAK